MPFQEKGVKRNQADSTHQHQHWQCPGSAFCTDFGYAGLPRPGTAASSRVLTCPLPFEGVPHVAVEVVVTCKQEAPALGEGDGGDPTDDVVVGIHHELLVCAQVEQPARGVVRAGGKRVSVREKLHGSIERQRSDTRKIHWSCICLTASQDYSTRVTKGRMFYFEEVSAC